MSIEDFIDKVQVQDFTNASPIFSELMAGKLSDALEQVKMQIAGEMFSSDADDDELEELSDEELDEILDDEDDEE
jgi:hypothetical protein